MALKASWPPDLMSPPEHPLLRSLRSLPPSSWDVPVSFTRREAATHRVHGGGDARPSSQCGAPLEGAAWEPPGRAAELSLGLTHLEDHLVGVTEQVHDRGACSFYAARGGVDLQAVVAAQAGVWGEVGTEQSSLRAHPGTGTPTPAEAPW